MIDQRQAFRPLQRSAGIDLLAGQLLYFLIIGGIKMPQMDDYHQAFRAFIIIIRQAKSNDPRVAMVADPCHKPIQPEIFTDKTRRITRVDVFLGKRKPSHPEQDQH